MGRKRYFCSHWNDFVSRGTRSRHLNDLAATDEAFFDSDQNKIPSESDRKILVCLRTTYNAKVVKTITITAPTVNLIILAVVKNGKISVCPIHGCIV